MDWSKYPSFKEAEFRCRHTGKCAMRPEFMDILQQIRTTYGRPMIINSGYRDRSHPVEAGKKTAGEHTYGLAADIRVYGEHAIMLQWIATEYGIRRFGIQQKGAIESRYIHIGYGDKGFHFPPALWSY
jgi:zinc D-Ala-D-Ala carboxypeptidase